VILIGFVFANLSLLLTDVEPLRCSSTDTRKFLGELGTKTEEVAMEEMWKIIPGVTTPFALMAFLIAALLVGYGIHRRRRYAPFDGITDPEVRLQMLRTLHGQHVPDMTNLTREQKTDIINHQIGNEKFKFTLVIVAGFLLAIVVIVAAIDAWRQPPPAQEQPKTSSLILRIENSSSADDPAPARKPAIHEPNFGVAERIEFSLANPNSGLAIIDEMAVEVLDVVEDNTGSTQAVVVHYKYAVDLTPTKGSVPFGEKFKYSPGEVDRFSVGAGATNGYDYFVRIVVRWFDAVSSEKRVTVSEPIVLCFPAPFPLNTPIAVREELQKQQKSRIEERLRQFSGN